MSPLHFFYNSKFGQLIQDLKLSFFSKMTLHFLIQLGVWSYFGHILSVLLPFFSSINLNLVQLFQDLNLRFSKMSFNYFDQILLKCSLFGYINCHLPKNVGSCIFKLKIDKRTIAFQSSNISKSTHAISMNFLNVNMFSSK